MMNIAWLWWCLGGLCAALISIGLMFSLVLRWASRLEDVERKLKASRQAHAMDVQALTTKLHAARAKASHE